jgi:hypothetical protein
MERADAQTKTMKADTQQRGITILFYPAQADPSYSIPAPKLEAGGEAGTSWSSSP